MINVNNVKFELEFTEEEFTALEKAARDRGVYTFQLIRQTLELICEDYIENDKFLDASTTCLEGDENFKNSKNNQIV